MKQPTKNQIRRYLTKMIDKNEAMRDELNNGTRRGTREDFNDLLDDILKAIKLMALSTTDPEDWYTSKDKLLVEIRIPSKVKEIFSHEHFLAVIQAAPITHAQFETVLFTDLVVEGFGATAKRLYAEILKDMEEKGDEREE